jgi:hypothetical protein
MSNDEMDKKMEFIVEQQAQFAADIEVMREIQKADTKLLKEETKLLKEQYRNLSDAVMTVVGLVGTMAQTQLRTEEHLNILAAAQTRTEDRLSVFINFVERYISGNGGLENPA